jgi:guanylate kinase
MSNRGSLFILSAPSGSGKTSLAHRVLPAVENLRFSVSHTTRERRRGEEDGREYFFVTVPVFESMIQKGRFLEWAEVYGNYYGTSRGFVESHMESGSDVLLDVDVQGAAQVRKAVPDSIAVFVLPPSFQELEARLRGRNLDEEEVIRRRLETAGREIQYYRDYDFVIINRDLGEAARELEAIVRAVRCGLRRRKTEAERILLTFPVG